MAMNGTRSFASLTPSLLANKGGAKPAMRPQVQPLHEFQQANAWPIEEDLGWNDMGHDCPEPDGYAGLTPLPGGTETAPISQDARIAPVARDASEVVTRLADLPERRAVPVEKHSSARADGRRVAFTLRLDAARHSKLRLASILENRSAQQLLTEALDDLLDDIPGLGSLADRIKRP